MAANPYESPTEPTNLPQPPSHWPRPSAGFLVVLGILGVFVLLIFPFGRGGAPREAARRMQCSNHLQQIGLALQNYHDDFGCLPPAYVADSSGKPIHSWRVLILPYLEQKALYDKYDFQEPWNGPHNAKLHDEIRHLYDCPSRSGRYPNFDTSYVAVVGANTAWPGAKAISYASITDRTSETLLIVEMANSGIHWMEPRDLSFDEIPIAINPPNGPGISSPHPNVALALFADGHTAAISERTPPEIVRRLLTIADGEPVGDY
jgi:hypothetical protein